MRARLRLPRYLPGRALQAFGAALAWVLELYNSSPTDAHLFGVLALPKLCSRLPASRGRFSSSELKLAIVRHLELFRSGQWADLWSEAQRDLSALTPVVETRATKRARVGVTH